MMAPLDSVHRALTLVGLLREGRVIGVTEAAAALDVAPSTAHRLLAALCFDDYAQQIEGRRYSAGPALHRLANRGLSIEQLRQATRPAIEDLNAVTNETVLVWILQGDRVRYVDGVESTQLLSVRAGMWDYVPAFSSAAGRAMLAELSDVEIERIHQRGLARAERSRLHTVAELEAHLEAVRRQGFALNIEEAYEGVNGISVAIRSPRGTPLAAIALAVPTVRFSQDAVERLLPALRQATSTAEHAIASPGTTRGGVSSR
ncbi:MAG: IclR family transcriptional regulator [Propionibacteriaceae bacterium]|nr:IclR family transcriptional regulator [Propionibacteriaceae bacterium]